MKRLLTFIAGACLALWAFNAAAASSPLEDKKYYTHAKYWIEDPREPSYVALVKFKPADGWKWNDKYPSKFKVTKPEAGSKPYRVVNILVEKQEDETWVWMEMQPSKAAKVHRQHFILKASYSFCDKSSCLVFKRDIKF
tara:strand:+ start:129 stop:545 length:417 start_codon:yes stop_codon:yes gene_type:complete